MKTDHLIPSLAAFFMTGAVALAQYPGWNNSGSVFLNTTPDGANLPASASVEEFPVLVRLHRDFFDFTTAKISGEDVRFSADGKPLVYQVEQWDASKGEASLWVRVPKISGNARQELKVHWGKADAASESNGKAVFNESNGYLAVLHMDDGVADEVGSIQTKDVGTAKTAGIIGAARHLAGKQGILCGEKIENFPVGSSPHSTEAWLRAEQSNGRALAWGNEHGQGKVVMHFMSPPHVKMECYFSGADVASEGRLPMNEWIHIFHTYEKGESRIYVNGELSNTSKTPDAPLAIKTPARLYIGGWYNNYDFIGDLDEVRISKVTRSADWVKLQFENQKPLQTLVGPVVQPGSTFAVSPAAATIEEGKSATFTAQAGGAQKVYWSLKGSGSEPGSGTLVAVDRLSFTYEAGRVPGDTALILQCRAIYPDGVKTKDIPIVVKEAIPDPVFTLAGPKAWDGRTPIELTPNVTNYRVMNAKRPAALKTTWAISGGAVIKKMLPGSVTFTTSPVKEVVTGPGKLVLERSQFSGKLTVTATISNGGTPASQSVEIAVTEPASDPWVARIPAKDEKPEDGQFFARDDKAEGTLHYNGTLAEAADEVFLRLYADDRLVSTATAKPDADRNYALSAKLKPGLIKYKVEFGTGKDTVLHTVGDLVCGDAYIIDGQSNALATDTGEKSPPETNEWIRSYARPSQDAKENTGKGWVLPVWKAEKGEKAELGWWGMELAKSLVESQKVPVFFINAAVGGTRIDQHQRDAANPTDLTTIYGRMLWRVQQARLTHGIRAILWHQGENDQGAAGPTGGFGWETYHEYFVEMAAGWKTDFPNVQNYYVYQIWPDACAMGGRHGSGDMLREKQRTLPTLFSKMSILSTLGVRPPGGCHFPLEGWSELAHMVQPLIERDHYGRKFEYPLTPPNLCTAKLAAPDSIVLEFDQPVVWDASLAGQFYLDGEKGKVASGSVAGALLTLKLAAPTDAAAITYLKEVEWSQGNLLLGANGLAALSFCKAPLFR